MDALKFAFEILIVGALALPWLAMLILMFAPAGTESERDVDSLNVSLSVIPVDSRAAVGVVLIVAVGYLLGSAVSRISKNLLNDELWRSFPTEDKIRAQVYHDEYCTENVLADLNFPETEFSTHSNIPRALCPEVAAVAASLAEELHPVSGTPMKDSLAKKRARLRQLSSTSEEQEEFSRRVEEIFRLQEGKLLLSGEDKTDRLKQYYDQITVLRGAAFNGVLLLAFSAFGLLATLRARFPRHRLVNALAFVPGGLFSLYGIYSLQHHWLLNADARYSDPPLAELVCFLLGVVGLLVVLKARTATYYVPTAMVATVLTVISFGGWWWTEVMYNLQVIHSVPQLSDQAGRPYQDSGGGD